MVYDSDVNSSKCTGRVVGWIETDITKVQPVYKHMTSWCYTQFETVYSR